MCVKTVQSNHSADSDFQITVKFTVFMKNKENHLLFAGQYRNRLQTSQDCRILFCFNSAIFCGGTMDPQPPQDEPNVSTTATPSRAANTRSYFVITGADKSFIISDRSATRLFFFSEDSVNNDSNFVFLLWRSLVNDYKLFSRSSVSLMRLSFSSTSSSSLVSILFNFSFRKSIS